MELNPLGLKLITPEHYYKDSEGSRYTSVTTYLNQFFPPFDVDGTKTESAAKTNGISFHDQKILWEANKINAAMLGTKIHKVIEDFIESNGVLRFDEQILSEVNLMFPEMFTPENFKKDYFISEQIIGDKDLGIAGTIDVVALNEQNQCILIDWKTNKKINFEPFGDKDAKLLEPFDFLKDTKFDRYLLQIYFYMAILQLNFDLDVTGAFIGHIPSDRTVTPDVSRLTCFMKNQNINVNLYKKVYSILEEAKKSGVLPQIDNTTHEIQVQNDAESLPDFFKGDFTKENQMIFAQKIIDKIEEGEVDPLKVQIALSNYDKISDAIKKGIKKHAIAEAEKYHKSDRKINGVSFSTYLTPSFKHKDETLLQMKKEVSEREKMLKELKEPTVDKETGELLVPPAVSYSETIRITFPKKSAKLKE